MANPFFNAKYYLEQNADVAEAVGGDEALAEQHYFLHGAGEARKPAPWFDIEFYRASREDLADVPADQLFLHFTLHGIGEGLSPAEGVDFDPVAYASAEGNEDLLEAFGIEDVEDLTEEQQEQLAQHFFAHGYKEGRDGGPDIPGWDGGDDVDRTELAAALQELTEANAAMAAFLKENGDDDGPATAEEIREAVTTAEGALTTARAGDSDAQLAADVAQAEADLSDALAAYNATEKTAEFRAAVSAYRREESKLATLENSLEAKEADANDQFAAFKEANPKKVFNADPETEGGLWDLTAVPEEDRATFDPETPHADAVLLAIYVPTSEHGGQVALVGGISDSDYPGLTAFFNATNAALSASVAVEEQKIKVTAAHTAIPDDSGNKALFQTVLDEEADLEAAEQAVTDREQLVQDVADAKALVEELEALEDDVTAALEALEELGYENVEAAEGTLVTSGDGDIYLFNEEDAEITGFGEVADDVLFFDVSEYTYNADGVDAGDNNALEVFLVQEGDDVHVLFEQEAYSSATEEFHTIVLVGTDLESVQVDDLGFISL